MVAQSTTLEKWPNEYYSYFYCKPGQGHDGKVQTTICCKCLNTAHDFET